MPRDLGHKHCPGLGESAQTEDFHLHSSTVGLFLSKARGCVQPSILAVLRGFSLTTVEFNPGSSVPLHLLVDIPNLLWKCHPSISYFWLPSSKAHLLEETQEALYLIFPLGAPPLAQRE